MKVHWQLMWKQLQILLFSFALLIDLVRWQMSYFGFFSSKGLKIYFIYLEALYISEE